VKVPKPTKDTSAPLLKVNVTASIVASKARAAAALEMSAFVAMCSISSVLFTMNLKYRYRINQKNLD
jgi:hypothetical protein